MPGCSAIGCKNRTEQGYIMKKFPKDEFRQNLWLAKMRRNRPNWTPTNHSYLCEVHFEARHWIMHEDGKKKLKKDAVPTIFTPNAAKPDVAVTPQKIETKFDKILTKIQDETLQTLLKMKDKKIAELEKALSKARDIIIKKAREIENLKRNSTPNPQYNFLLLQNNNKKTAPGKKRAAPAVSISNQPDTELIFDPQVIIKEEPIDIDEHPFPSTSGTDPEFILPFTDPFQSSSATAVEEAFTIVKTEPVEEEQPVITNGFSILKRPPSKENITKEIEQSVPAEKNSANPENQSTCTKDPLDAYGEYIVAELKILDSKSCAYVQKVIAYVLNDAKLGKFK